MIARFSCFSSRVGKKKKSKVDACNKDHGTLEAKLEHRVETSKEDRLNLTSFDELVSFGIQGSSTCKVKGVSNDVNSVEPETAELAYEGSDELDESPSIQRDLSDFDLQARVPAKDDDVSHLVHRVGISCDSIDIETNGNRSEREEGSLQCGHLSDPGIGRRPFWGSPKLKRSCSNLETRAVLEKMANQLPPSKSHSLEDLQNLTENNAIQEIQSSPLSVKTSCSADRVMLKKRSSSQVLPSRSRRLWWKLFLWSHRNLHKPSTSKAKQLSIVTELSNRKEGYSSDTLEPSRALDSRKNNGKSPLNLDSPELFSSELKDNITSSNKQNWNNLWPQNQWVAFSTETNLTRIDEWVNSLETQPTFHVENNDDGSDGETSHDIVFPPSPENGGPLEKNPHIMRRYNSNLVEEILQANNVIQSLNSFSAIAHIAGMGLKVIPAISHFSSLRSVNLSGNFIVHINQGSLPKSLHTLNLSRNKIVTIEGLRELTRLRVLDLSYNRIARIGQGLSNCTIIKELYLAGNKISDVEGLHRLLKLTVLDLSFNKITTAKALGQLVANYSSLLALNLLGNPIQSNIGDDQLRKTVLSLLPQLAYLNKQPIKPQRAREAATDRVAKAALGNSGWNPRKKTQKRAIHGSFSSSKSRGQTGGQKNRHRPKRSSTFASN